MQYYVYIAKSLKDNGYYIGSTSNIADREESHNAGRTKSTKVRRPLKIFYFEKYDEKPDALKREKFLKSSKGYKEKIEIIKKHDKDHNLY